MGNSQACGTCTFSLEEEKRNSAMRFGPPGTGHAAGSTPWHLGTSGALWVAEVLLRPPALLQTRLL